MGEIVEISDFDLQEVVVEERERKGKKLADLLREEMDGVDHHREEKRKWKILKQRLRLNKISGCCGAGCSFRVATSDTLIRDEGEIQEETTRLGQIPVVQTTPASIGMNLATALAAERQFREAQELETGGFVGLTEVGPTTPPRMLSIRLLEETNGVDEEREKEKEKGVGRETMCCVCMGRKKGAAFIPCGHTFCRVCSREIWLNRGSCPFCNRFISEILDIF